MSESATRIGILGGGFGGLYTALRLSQFPWQSEQMPQITLIDKSDRFLFTPLLYELMTGEIQTWEIAPPFSQILANTSIRFQQDQVTGIDVKSRTVQVQSGDTVNYDCLVIAMGGDTPLNIVSGAKEHAIPFKTLEDAYRLGDRLRLLEQSNQEKIRIAIVGGGYSGVELGCKLADRLGDRGRIRIIERGNQILSTSPNFNRETAKSALEDRQIWIDLETEVTEMTADTLFLQYKGKIDPIPVDIVIWTVGTQVSPMIQNLSLAHSKKGQLTLNSYLQIPEHPEIYALGDVADCYDQEGNSLPATAQVAFQQSDYCAWNIWASLSGKPLLSFKYQPLGEMLTLGVDDATLSGLGLKVSGLPAYLARRLIYLYRLPTFSHQVTVGLNWMMQPLIEGLKEVVS